MESAFTTDAPTSNVVASWDVSLNGDGSVTASLQLSTFVNDVPYYILYISGATSYSLPANSSNYFANYNSCYDISGMELLVTSSVTDMSSMFENCGNLSFESTAFSTFSTTKVKDMSRMFYNCWRFS